MFALVAATVVAATEVKQAGQAGLASIKGIGPAIADDILDERKKINFKDRPDLVERVKDVGDSNAAKFSTEYLTVMTKALPVPLHRPLNQPTRGCIQG